MITRDKIADIFGETWVDFFAPFVQSEKFDLIMNTIKAEKADGKIIFPEKSTQVFSAFKELPLNQVRIIVLGQDPYPTDGYAIGKAFAHPMDRKVAPSLAKVIDAIEVDSYNGLNFDKEKFDTTLAHWTAQGILLLNTALTVRKKEADSHAELWKEFTQYVVDTIGQVKRDIIWLCWGKNAQNFTEKISPFVHYRFVAEHPAFAARNEKPWDCKHFSLTNAVITANNLGETIKW